MVEDVKLSVTTVVHFIVILLIIGIFIYFVIKSTTETTPTTPKNGDTGVNAKLNPEIIKKDIFIDITNRNNYIWHDVKVIANEYYSCFESNTLAANEKITVNTLDCKDSTGNPLIGIKVALQSLKITSKEGAATYLVQ